jgi:osmotically inducible lipoprotein OsmB
MLLLVCRSRIKTAVMQSTQSEKGIPMKTMQKFTVNTIALAVLLGLGACSGMSARDESTAIGAGVGAVGGAVLTGGSPAGVVGGAVVGGVIGNQVGRHHGY